MEPLLILMEKLNRKCSRRISSHSTISSSTTSSNKHQQTFNELEQSYKNAEERAQLTINELEKSSSELQPLIRLEAVDRREDWNMYGGVWSQKWRIL